MITDTFLAEDGEGIFYRVWPADGGPKAILAVAHGLGEHSGRYRNLADYFIPRGFSIYALDHRGHGQSPGKRGHITDFNSFNRDLYAFIQCLGKLESAPIFLVGHSMGGLIAANYAIDKGYGLSGLVLSNPALGIEMGISPLKIVLGRVMARIFPSLTMPNGIDPCLLTHDEEEVRKYKEDPLVHDRVSAGLFFGMLETMEKVVSYTGEIDAPLLMIIGGRDRICSSGIAKRFFSHVDKEGDEVMIFEGMYHEPFNEVDRNMVYQRMREWLEDKIKLRRKK